jgi:hypothetical protein
MVNKKRRLLLAGREGLISFYRSMGDRELAIWKAELKNKACFNCTNDYCRSETYDKGLISESASRYIADRCTGWDNPELVAKSRILNKRNLKRLK